MDVLKPEVYWVGNRCYRVNPGRAQSEFSSNWNSVGSSGGAADEGRKDESHINKPYVEADDFEGAEEESGMEIGNIEIIRDDTGLKSVCSIPSSLFPHVIGSKGAVKKRLEMETRTRIFVPRQNEKGDIVVRGQNEGDIRKACKRLNQIALNARFKREPTHFICYPINQTAVKEKVKDFTDKVLSECGLHSRGLDSSIFQPPEKLHLTICVMVLLDERERSLADEVLKDMQTDIRGVCEGKSLKIRLKGLEIMNDDPSNVDVLYAKCEPTDTVDALQIIADLVAKKFTAKGFGKETRGEKVKLHCTVINTRFRNEGATNDNKRYEDNNRGRNNGHNNRESFDARSILQKFGEFDFGSVEISDIKIATRHTKGNDGFYRCYSSLPLIG